MVIFTVQPFIVYLPSLKTFLKSTIILYCHLSSKMSIKVSLFQVDNSIFVSSFT